jgi:hypothetical protein
MEASRASRSRERTPRRQGTTPGRLYHGREILGRDGKLEFEEDGGVRCLGCGRRYDGNAQCNCTREEHEAQSPLFQTESSPRENMQPTARRLWHLTGRNLFGESPLCNSPSELGRLRAGVVRCGGSAEHPIADPAVLHGAHPAVLFATHTIPASWHAAIRVRDPQPVDLATIERSRESVSPTQWWSGTQA